MSDECEWSARNPHKIQVNGSIPLSDTMEEDIVYMPLVFFLPNEIEKTEFDIFATEYDWGRKIEAIKAIRDINKMTLLKAKDFIESLPKEVCEGATYDQALEMKLKLESSGIRVNIK